jgi:CheY-like chemotaxis protein
MARILIVEDDPINAEVAAIICRANRHVVTVVEDGVQALMALDAQHFDLILSDVVMPRMDGITMTGLIRGSGGPYANIPIIGMTALAGKRELITMIDAGMDHVVTKPFRNSALLRVVEDALYRAANHDVKIYRLQESAQSLEPLPKAE